MEKVILKSGRELPAEGIFVAVGTNPNVQVIEKLTPEKDEE
jgi:hypothetical protein